MERMTKFPTWYEELENNSISVDGVTVDAYSPPKIVAELGINHGGCIKTAKELAKLASDSGADIIKTQIHRPTDEMSQKAKEVIPGHTKESIFEIIQECSLDVAEEIELAEYIRSLGKPYLSTPFSLEAVDFLESINVSAYKIGSGECNHVPLLEKIAKTKKPVIMSTGMNNLDSVKSSYKILKEHKVDIVLMHTTNIYPTPSELVRLEALREIMQGCQTKNVGLSDHTTSNLSAYGAMALGATLIERHFTDTKSREGADISCSMTPTELEQLKEAASDMNRLRWGSKANTIPEEDSARNFAFATAVAKNDIAKGSYLSEENISWKRPGVGDFKPTSRESLYNKVARRTINEGEHIMNNDII